jgi:hypothetical protein
MKILCEIQDYGKRKIKYGGKKYHVHLKQFFFSIKVEIFNYFFIKEKSLKSEIIFSLKKTSKSLINFSLKEKIFN